MHVLFQLISSKAVVEQTGEISSSAKQVRELQTSNIEDCKSCGHRKKCILTCASVQIYQSYSSPFITFHFTGLPRSGKNIWKMKIFPGQVKVREFCGWPGKGLGKSGNLKINGYSRLSSGNLFILFKRGKDVLSRETV